MFETLEVGKQLDKDSFDERELELRKALQQAQRRANQADYPVIIIVAGAEGAGKGSVVHKLNEWMDPRSIEVSAFWERSDEEESRPYFWRFWRKLPNKGQMGIFFGAWYTNPLYGHATDTVNDAAYKVALERIREFEQMLADDGALFIKLWFHVSRDVQRMQLAQEAPRKQQNLRTGLEDLVTDKLYKKFLKSGEQAVLETDSSHAPWQLIEASDRYYRNFTAGQTILEAMERHHSLRTAEREQVAAESPVPTDDGQPTVLGSVDLSKKLERSDYKQALRKAQEKLQELAWQMRARQRSMVAVFEGWDAAGKGSAIRRVTGAIDPRIYRLLQYAAPTDEEKAHHYLWRFWRQLARDGTHTFFDRSWYGRVLVERVEGFAATSEWQRAYNEINRFEAQLADHGSVMLKFWIHIDQDEQLRRFKEREEQPHKQYKITEEDWRNRDRWGDYEQAVDQMVARTSTHYAPWTLVSGNDKLFARIQILKTFCERLEEALDSD